MAGAEQATGAPARRTVIGTAGHIDHGKTSLVRALTGIDCDRWREEKERGITIDLGFAWLREGDLQVGFVDVPGHEKFLHNALAGLGVAVARTVAVGVGYGMGVGVGCGVGTAARTTLVAPVAENSALLVVRATGSLFASGGFDDVARASIGAKRNNAPAPRPTTPIRSSSATKKSGD